MKVLISIAPRLSLDCSRKVDDSIAWIEFMTPGMKDQNLTQIPQILPEEEQREKWRIDEQSARSRTEYLSLSCLNFIAFLD